MGLAFRRLSRALGAEILNVDLARPMDAETRRELRRVWLDHNILLFKGQDLTPEQQIAFSRTIGDLELHTFSANRMPDYPEIFVNSNIVVNGQPLGAQKSGRFWHSDSQFLKLPSMATILYAREAPPEGGDTAYANMCAAYDALDAATRALIAGLTATFSRIKSWEVGYKNRAPMTEEQKRMFPDVTHPLVRVHPETGRKALYVGSHEERVRIEGLPAAEGEALARRLYDHATEARFVYRHHWDEGDVILWDNRSTMHCALPFDEAKYRRLMYRTTIQGDAPRGAGAAGAPA
jgi:alpha-ketoglutarate-dependent taurine dioxygenase